MFFVSHFTLQTWHFKGSKYAICLVVRFKLMKYKENEEKKNQLYKIYFEIYFDTAERRTSAFGGRLRLFFPETEVAPQVTRQQLIRSCDTCCLSFFRLLTLAWVRLWRVAPVVVRQLPCLYIKYYGCCGSPVL